ncbi:hypothetical protein INT47_011774 [Mucor saturninus]|uniref:Reverse transcriptase zinc-binding domain-containing protein n=1 Tax=Mucor saturninus TaxID=64648 RepID=A0A8H7UUG9_9FUNG|nr:hypothetical protein INT47_011774 [Mucor saturninus]
MLDHLSHFQTSSLYPLLPLYDPEFRKSPVLNKFSIWHVIFETFDYFQSSTKLQMINVPVSTILALPLRKIIQVQDISHWSLRHRNFAAGLFLIFDEQQQRLRLRVTHEFSRFPRLCQSLANDILCNRTIKLEAFVWPHILTAPTSSLPPESWSSHNLVSQVRTQQLWTQFQPNSFRRYYQQQCSTTHNFQIRNIKQFWRCRMFPQARTVYYRVFSRCIPTKQLMFKHFGNVSSPQCSFCGTAEDSITHFLVECPIKRQIWQRVMSHYYPYLEFTPTMLYESLCSLKHPLSMQNNEYYLAIVSTTLWQIWNLYWLHGTDNPRPYPVANLPNFASKVIQQINKIIHPVPNLD